MHDLAYEDKIKQIKTKQNCTLNTRLRKLTEMLDKALMHWRKDDVAAYGKRQGSLLAHAQQEELNTSEVITP